MTGRRRGADTPEAIDQCPLGVVKQTSMLVIRTSVPDPQLANEGSKLPHKAALRKIMKPHKAA